MYNNQNQEEETQERIEDEDSLIEWWKELKDIPARYNDSSNEFHRLLTDAYKLVDTSDLDEWIENYDFNQRGNRNYHKIMGKKFRGLKHLDEVYEDYPSYAFESIEGKDALEKMSQKVLARCYIVMNRLLHGKEPVWEEKINGLASNWVKKSLQEEFEERTTIEKRSRLPQLLQEALENQNQTFAQQELPTA